MSFILKTEILFTDQLSEKMGTPEKFIWGDHWIDLREVVAFGEHICDNERTEFTEILLRGGSGRVIKITPKEFAKKMQVAWGSNYSDDKKWVVYPSSNRPESKDIGEEMTEYFSTHSEAAEFIEARKREFKNQYRGFND